MRKLLTVAAMTLLFPLAASAQLRLGASIGYSKAMGDVFEGMSVDDWGVSGSIPMEISGAFLLSPQLDLGVYVGFAPLLLTSNQKDYCDYYGLTCTYTDLRFGAKGEFRLASQGIIPWVGANFGWEWLTEKEELGGDSQKWTLSGWEFGVRGGFDTMLSPQFSVGLFAGLSFGKFTDGEYSCDIAGLCSGSSSGSIPSGSQTIHQWLTIGVRGNIDLGGGGYAQPPPQY